MSVPPALKRPCLSWVAPRNAAANAGSRYGVPAVGDPLPSVDARTMPVAPGQPSGRDERQEAQAVDAHAREPRGVRVEPGGVQAPAGRGVLEQVPDRERDDGAVEDAERDAADVRLADLRERAAELGVGDRHLVRDHRDQGGDQRARSRAWR